MVVPVAHARVDENAVVVGLGYASLAHATVLGTRRFEESTGLALGARMEERVVIRV